MDGHDGTAFSQYEITAPSTPGEYSFFLAADFNVKMGDQ